MAPPSLDAIRAAYGAFPVPDPLARPGRDDLDEVIGMDLPDRRGRPARRPPPELPPRPPSAWPWWAPAWLELPLPECCPPDAWYFRGWESRHGVVPHTWFVPVGNTTDVDPIAILMLWAEPLGVQRPWAFQQPPST